MLQIPAAAGSRIVAKLSTNIQLPECPVQQRLAHPSAYESNAKRYVVLEGESTRTLSQSAIREESPPRREAVLEGSRTAKYSDDLVVHELCTFQWKGTERSLPVELQWPGYEARPSTFFIVNSSYTRVGLTVKIAQWVRAQLDELREASLRTTSPLDLKTIDQHQIHLIGLFGITDESHEIFKYVVDLSVDQTELQVESMCCSSH